MNLVRKMEELKFEHSNGKLKRSNKVIKKKIYKLRVVGKEDDKLVDKLKALKEKF